MTRFAISQPVTQEEAPRLLTGKGRFADDLTFPRQAHGVFLRSPYAHADIVSIDKSEAEKMPGVIAILTGEDYEADGLGTVRGISPMKRRDGSSMYRPHRPALTRDRVRHVGQSVALVIAETISQGKDAAEAIEVEYNPLPAHFSTAEANQPGTPQIWEECENNEPVHVERGDSDAVDAAIAEAHHVVRGRFVVNRIAACTMEPRAVVALWDEGTQHYTIHACHQRPYIWRTMMTKYVFGIPEQDMTIIAGDVGGSYGMKGGLYPEVPLTAWAAKRTGRPVKWTCERSEALICDDQARDMVVDGELALDADGKFTGVRIRSNNNVGAYLTMIGFISTNGITQTPVGTYTTPAAHAEANSVFTNTVPVSNYRAPGGVPGTYVLERMIDLAAADMGIDPAEIRRRNLIPADAMPYKLPLGGGYDCGEFEKVLDKALEKSDYANAATRRADAEARGMLYGVGVSSSVDPSAGPSPETAELRFDPGGQATILAGSTAGGQSHETIYKQIVSDRLGMDVESLRVIEGDTKALSWGTGTGGARTATIAGTAIYKAVDKVIEKSKKIAAHLMEAAAEDIEFEDGTFTVAGTDRTVTFQEVAETAFSPNKLPPDIEIGLYETATWSPDEANVPNSAHVCEVEIDPDTGVTKIVRYTAVHDVGVELNPLLVDGQVHGGIAQGVGQAICEDIRYDPESGQVLTGSFLDYCMPRADDFCDFTLDRHPVPTATNPLGVKGAGECGTVGALAATMNAINDALRPLGIRDMPMPATPDRVWRAIRDAKQEAA